MAFHKSFVLLSCTFLGLVCGTLYLYLLFGPQLAQRLDYLATDSSQLALCGLVGVALAGPGAGKLVDSRGFLLAIGVGAVVIALAYWGLRYQYVVGEAAALVPLLMALMFLIGCGLTFINLATIKCCAVCFPSIRGVATSLPLALYGLLAMVFSQMASVICPGDTAKFLGFLAVLVVAITAVCLPLIWFVDRIGVDAVVGAKVPADASISGDKEKLATTKAYAAKLESPRLVTSPQFWTFFIVLGLGAALGQMYIYLVGYMVKALLPKGTSEKIAAKTQQGQVLIILIANCIGRIVAGLLGDYVVLKKIPRSVLLLVPTLGLVISQLLGLHLRQASQLFVALWLNGFSYGFLFCAMPAVVADVFGLEKFSYNWGVINLAPIVPLYLFTLWFGKVYDANSEVVVMSLADAATDALVVTKTHQCLHGAGCYAQVFRLTLWVAVLLVLVVLFYFSRRRWHTVVS